MEIIVTSGQPFTDIDALSCAIAYTELLIGEGKITETVLPGVFNKSITEKIKSWDLKYKTEPSSSSAKYILVDISDPKFFANFVDEKFVIEVFDHRYGFEEYWKRKLNNCSHIEMVGSCATLIWEEFIKRVKPLKVSTTSANLLYTTIASNTLNFRASVTTDRDQKAFSQLKRFADLDNQWITEYFKGQDAEVVKDIEKSIINDTKDLKPIIAQLELWDSKNIIFSNLHKIEKAILCFNKPDWFLTSPSISEGKNYLFTKSQKIKRLLEKTIDAKFDGDIGITKKLWLRKEIYKKMQQTS